MADSLSRILVETHELQVSFFIQYYLRRYGARFKPADHKIKKKSKCKLFKNSPFLFELYLMHIFKVAHNNMHWVATQHTIFDEITVFFYHEINLQNLTSNWFKNHNLHIIFFQLFNSPKFYSFWSKQVSLSMSV